MQQKRVHYFHANADAFGGRIERPFEQVLPSLAASSLSPAGGYGSARHGKYTLGEIFSIDAAYTQVGGSFDEVKGSWTTIVTSVLEGVNIGNVVFADRIAAQISTEHPLEGYFPKVSFVGTQFSNLRVGSCPLTPVLNLDLCTEGDGREYPKTSCFENEEFLAIARRQNDQLGEIRSGQPEEKRGAFSWLERYRKDGDDTGEIARKRGNVLCSVVEEIKGRCAGETFGHVIDIPEFGKIFLGELIVDYGSFDLTMIRFELGSPAKAHGSGGHGSANGTSAP